MLAIIGAVLVSVLQGRALIANAEYKSLRRSLADYAEAFQVFRERYNALPGDFAEADSHLGLDSADNGNGDGVIDDGPACASPDDESCRAWQHLRAASLLKGNPGEEGAAAEPTHSYNGHVSSFFTGTAGNNEFGHKMLVENLPARVARRLDDDLDDSMCDSGYISMDPRDNCVGSAWPDDADVDVAYAL